MDIDPFTIIILSGTEIWKSYQLGIPVVIGILPQRYILLMNTLYLAKCSRTADRSRIPW